LRGIDEQVAKAAKAVARQSADQAEPVHPERGCQARCEIIVAAPTTLLPNRGLAAWRGRALRAVGGWKRGRFDDEPSCGTVD
jgi:hypothetical protein